MATLRDFQTGISEFARNHDLRTLHADQQFAVWWVAARLTDYEDVPAARQALPERAKDGGLDAVYVRDADKTVFLVQAKLHEDSRRTDSRQDISELTRWAHLLLSASRAEWDSALAEMSPSAQHLVTMARDRLKSNYYELVLQFISTGRINAKKRAHQEEIVRRVATRQHPARLQVFQSEHVLGEFEDYKVQTPPVGEVSLSLEPDYLISKVADFRMLVGLVRGDDLATAVDDPRVGWRLFAANVRGDLGGANEVNKKIEETISDRVKSAQFPFMNNGLTVLCREFDLSNDGTKLHLLQPQVVNGQQTAVSLARAAKRDAARVRVVAKFIEVPREGLSGPLYNEFVDGIVRATNHQTKVDVADLYANDSRQIELGRRLHQHKFYYRRKRFKSGPRTGQLPGGFKTIDRKELLDAVAGCIEESLPYRKRKEELYREDQYNAIFDLERRSDREFLAMYYLRRHIRLVLKSQTLSLAQRRSQWLVQFYAWKHLQFGAPAMDSFWREMSAATPDRVLLREFSSYVKALARGAEKFFKSPHPALPRDPTNFFKTPSLYGRFAAYLRRESNVLADLRKREKAIAERLKACAVEHQRDGS